MPTNASVTDLGGVAGGANLSPTASAGGAAGFSGPLTAVQSSSVVSTATTAKSANYTLVVQIPLPFLNLNLNLNLVADFIMPVLTALGVPPSVAWLEKNISKIVNNIMDDAMMLIRAIPEATVTIVVKLGPVAVLNVQLVAKKVPVVVPVPAFQLDLPNLGMDANFNVPIPLPTAHATIEVPIPVPVVAFPPALLTVTGGQVSGSASAQPVPVSNPVYLPKV